VEAGVNERWGNSRREGKIKQTRGTRSEIGGDWCVSNVFANMVTETKADKVINRKESRTDLNGKEAGFDRGVVSTGRDVVKCRDELGRTVSANMLQKEISQVIKTTSFKVRRFLDSNSRWHK
jgi:hypothetical protein